MKHIVNITDNIITVDVSDNIIEVSVPDNKPLLVKVPKTLDEKIKDKIPQVKDGKQGLRGLKGEKGDKGDKGDDGKDFKFEDFTPQQLARLEGPEGPRGIPGVGIGIAAGGTIGQVLAKKSDTNYDTEWVTGGESDTLQSVTERGATFEAYNKNLLSYPYTIEETSGTITTIIYTTLTGTITKTITEVSPTITTIVLSGIPAGLPTTKTITETSPTLVTIIYS